MKSKLSFFIKTFYIILPSCLFILFAYHGFNGFSYEGISKSLFHSDFYINYEGGFMRRGLDGESIFLLSKYFSWNPLILQKAYNAASFLLFIVLVGIFIFRNRPPFYILFSMSVFLLYIYYLDRGIRKDHIIIILFVLNLWITKLKRGSFIQIVIFQNLILILSILLHEIAFLISFFPLLMINTLTLNPSFNIKKESKIILGFVPSLLVFMIVSFISPGNQEQKSIIINSWKTLGLQNEIIFNQGIFGDSLYIWNLGITFNQYILLAVILAIHFIFVFIGIYNNLKENNAKNILTLLLSLQYLVTILLIIVAVDYSRWIFFANLTTIFTIYFIQNNFKNKKTGIYLPQLNKCIIKSWFIPYILYFFVSIGYYKWDGLDGYIKSHPVHLVYKMFYGDDNYLFRMH